MATKTQPMSAYEMFLQEEAERSGHEEYGDGERAKDAAADARWDADKDERLEA